MTASSHMTAMESMGLFQVKELNLFSKWKSNKSWTAVDWGNIEGWREITEGNCERLVKGVTNDTWFRYRTRKGRFAKYSLWIQDHKNYIIEATNEKGMRLPQRRAPPSVMIKPLISPVIFVKCWIKQGSAFATCQMLSGKQLGTIAVGETESFASLRIKLKRIVMHAQMFTKPELCHVKFVAFFGNGRSFPLTHSFLNCRVLKAIRRRRLVSQDWILQRDSNGCQSTMCCFARWSIVKNCLTAIQLLCHVTNCSWEWQSSILSSPHRASSLYELWGLDQVMQVSSLDPGTAEWVSNSARCMFGLRTFSAA